jgi:transcriptional regulator with XRE-family HTH domain
MQERHLAARIAHERTLRDWTFDGLAKRMTDAGCPIRGSAIYKTENNDRRITVAEHVALSEVLGIPLEELLVPPDLAANRQAVELWQRYVAAIDEETAVSRKLEAHLRLHPDTMEALRPLIKDYFNDQDGQVQRYFEQFAEQGRADG